MALAFCCGWECGAIASGAAPDGLAHWDSITGTHAIESVITKHSSRSLKLTGVASAANYARACAGGAGATVIVGKIYVYFSSLPDGNTDLVYATTDAGGAPRILYHQSTGTFRAAVGAATSSSGPAVSADRFYRIDWRFTCNGVITVVDWAIDGTAQTQFSQSATTNSFPLHRVGWDQLVTAVIIFDELELSHTSGDYPIGDGKVIQILPVSDGTHSFTLGDFKYDNTTNIQVSATDVYTYLNHIDIGSGDGLISQNVTNGTGYVEVVFGTTPESADARGVEVVSACNSVGINANNCTLKLNDGGTLNDVFTNRDVSDTANFMMSKHYSTAPTGGAWTQAKLTGLKARWGYSTDVADIPQLRELQLEVAYPVIGLVLYPKDAAAPSSNMGEMQVGGVAPTPATTTTGWTVGTTAAGNYSRMDFAVERASGTFGATAQPSGAPDNTLGDCFRTTSPLSGTFAAGNWDVAFLVRAVTAAGGQDGRLRIRIWKSANADGSSATEITSGAVQLSVVTDLAVGVDQISSGNIALSSFQLNNEYLFFQLAWEITGAAS